MIDEQAIEYNPLFAKIKEDAIVDAQGMYFGDDIEGLLKEYLSNIRRPDGQYFTPNLVKLERVKIPVKFGSPNEEAMWWKEQYKRCKYGYTDANGRRICGSYYFYYNFCKLRNKDTGSPLQPNLRRIDIEYFEMAERMLFGDLSGNEKEMVNSLGMYWLKRRQIGHTAKTHALMIWIAMFFNNFTSVTTAVNRDLGIKLLANQAKFIYKHLPQKLKEGLAVNNELEMVFGKPNSRPVVGTNGKIEVVLPDSTGSIGTGNKMAFLDEIGETSNPEDFINKLHATLTGNEGFVRLGLLNIGGTAGDMGKVGNEAMQIWHQAHNRDLVRFFIAGWVGTNVDEYGNEVHIEKTVRNILIERKKRLNNKKDLYEYVRMYPLTPEEAFMQSGESKFDIERLNARDYHLHINNFEVPFRGWFEKTAVGVIFRPDINGKWLLLEHPKHGVEYLFGADPYEKGKVNPKTGSRGATIGYKPDMFVQGEESLLRALVDSKNIHHELAVRLQIGGLPIAMFVDEGRDHVQFYEQSALCATYFNEAKILIENNRNGMIEWFKNNGYSHLLKRSPNKPTQVYMGRTQNSYGYYRGEEEKEADIIRVDAYVNTKCSTIFFRPLLKALMSYRPDSKQAKNDETDAFSACLFNVSVSGGTRSMGTGSVLDLPKVTSKGDKVSYGSRDLSYLKPY